MKYQQESSIGTSSWTSLLSPSLSHPSRWLQNPFDTAIPWVIQQIPIGCLFYIWYCKFPCYLSRYILLSPSSPTRSSVSIGLFSLFLHCCPANKFVSTIFLNSIYVHQYLYLYFWLTSLYIIGSRSIHLIRTDSNVFLFNGWVRFHHIYVPQLLYPFICQLTSRLLLCPSYCR